MVNKMSVEDIIDGLLDAEENVGGIAIVSDSGNLVSQTENWDLTGDVQNVLNAIKNAKAGKIEEGNVGAGTGTVCFGFKGGIGTSSRVLPKSLGGYTIGVLVQTNFGGVLEINGAPIAKEFGKYPYKNKLGYALD